MNFAGKIIAIVASVVSSVAVLMVISMTFIYIRKHRYVQKKRKGTKSFFTNLDDVLEHHVLSMMNW